VTILAAEAGVRAPVVAHLVPWLHGELARVADTRIGHDELLHGETDLSVVDATIVVGVEGVEEPLGLIGRHVIVEDSKEAHDLVEGDGTVAGDLEPGALELGLTLGGPDGLVVHVGAELTAEDGVAAREAAHGGCRGHSAEAGLAVAGHAGHGGLSHTGHSVTRHSGHRRLIHLYRLVFVTKGSFSSTEEI